MYGHGASAVDPGGQYEPVPTHNLVREHNSTNAKKWLRSGDGVGRRDGCLPWLQALGHATIDVALAVAVPQ